MRIDNFPFDIVRWASQPAVTQPGTSGIATVKTVRLGEMRLRKIEFTPGYCADHWGSKGHIGFVLSGSLSIALENGGVFEVPAGDSFHVGDDRNLHRAETRTGATVILVD
jgi:quercetin dioxygenase-like cupin family protein